MLEHSEQAKKFYNSKQWRNTRNAYIDSVNAQCERCKDAGYIVHHIEHITIDNINDPFITLSWENLEYLCLQCHNEEHFKTNHSTNDEVTFDLFGNLIKR